MKPAGIILAALLALAAAARAEPPAAPVDGLFNVGIGRAAFLGVNENDAVAAFRVFSETLARKNGYRLRTVVHSFSSDEAFARAIRRGEVEVIVCGSWQYFTMGIQDLVDVSFVYINGGAATHRWMVLAQAGGGLRTLADLRGRAVIGLYNSRSAVGWQWIDSLLREGNLGQREAFFGSMDTVSKPSVAILPVFFGKADACIVDDTAFATMSALNPQIGRRLVPLATSEPLLSGLVCLNRCGWPTPAQREDARRALGELDSDAAGRQMLALFKTDRLAPFHAPQLESIRRLFTHLPSAPLVLPP